MGTMATGVHEGGNSLYKLPVKKASNAFTNTDLNPSEVYENFWLFEESEAITSNEPEPDGDFRMVVNPEVADEFWQKARKFYNDGEFQGIHSMHVSTAKSHMRDVVNIKLRVSKSKGESQLKETSCKKWRINRVTQNCFIIGIKRRPRRSQSTNFSFPRKNLIKRLFRFRFRIPSSF